MSPNHAPKDANTTGFATRSANPQKPGKDLAESERAMRTFTKRMTKRINAMTFHMISAAQTELYELLQDEYSPEQLMGLRSTIAKAKYATLAGKMHLAPMNVRMAARMMHLLALCPTK